MKKSYKLFNLNKKVKNILFKKKNNKNKSAIL